MPLVNTIDGTLNPITPGADWVHIFTCPDGTQLITISGATGGTWIGTFINQATTALAYNASTDAVRAAFEALNTIRPGNVAVSGTPGAWILTPQNNLDTGRFLDNPILVNGALLTGSGITYNSSRPMLDISGNEYHFQARPVPGVQDTSNDIVLTEVDDTDMGIILNGGPTGEIQLIVYASKTETLDWSLSANGGNTAACVLIEDDGVRIRGLAEGQLILEPLIFIPAEEP